MKALRVLPVTTLTLLAAFWVLRVGARGCSGGACEWLIPLSLLVPILVLVLLVVIAMRAVTTASAAESPGWTRIVSIAAAISIAGPILALVVWRDHPDTFVAVATILAAVLPVASLAFSLRRRRNGSAA